MRESAVKKLFEDVLRRICRKTYALFISKPAFTGGFLYDITLLLTKKEERIGRRNKFFGGKTLSGVKT